MLIDTFNFSAISLPALVLLALTGTLLLLGRDWRWMILVLAMQYVGVFLLVALAWPLEIALVKLVAGWMAGSILGLATSNAPEGWLQDERFAPSGRVFRLLAVGLVFIVVFSFAPALAAWLSAANVEPAALEHAQGGLILISLGLLNLGLTSQPMRVVTALLTALSGFEVLYATVETSMLVAGLLAGVNIGLALVGAYLLLAPGMEDEE